MNFHSRYEKQMTPQKAKISETSPAIKRIRLISPSPTSSKTISAKSDDLLISSNSPDHTTDMVDDVVSSLLLFN